MCASVISKLLSEKFVFLLYLLFQFFTFIRNNITGTDYLMRDFAILQMANNIIHDCPLSNVYYIQIKFIYAPVHRYEATSVYTIFISVESNSIRKSVDLFGPEISRV